jgi:hypothetical protein
MPKRRYGGAFAPLAFPPRRPSGYVRYGMIITLIILVWYAVNHSAPPTRSPSRTAGHSGSGRTRLKPGYRKGDHPIDKLIGDADSTFTELMSRQSNTAEAAARAYRERRGRHPPPYFDLWFQFARNRSAVIVEDFFDQIYHDLEPFWGMPPALLRREANAFEMRVHVRNGRAHTDSDWFWTLLWLDLIQTFEHLLPDMDLALNPMDEPRLIVPWEDIRGYMEKAAQTVNIPPANEVVNDYQKLPKPGTGDLEIQVSEKDWESTSKSFIQNRII